MLHIDQSELRIQAFAAAMGWSAARYAKAAGIPKTTAYEALKGGNATKATLRAMESIIPAQFKCRRPRKPSTTQEKMPA